MHRAGGLFLFQGLLSAKSAPQEAAAAAIAMCITIIPYCFVRAISALADEDNRDAEILHELKNISAKITPLTDEEKARLFDGLR